MTERELLEVLSIFAQRLALIVENHRVYSQLLDSKRKMEAVVLSISDGVIVIDADLNILISNSLADQLLGVPHGGSNGYPLPKLIENEDLTTLVRECIAESAPNSMDIDLGPERDLRTYQTVVHPIVAPELGALGAVLTLRDVTAERATERAKSDFLSIVSHELRTPLNSVMGFLDIILMGKTGSLTELQTDFLGTAKQEAVVLQRLINDLLDYSQLQSRMLRLEMAPLNLSSVIARVVNQAVPRMAEDGLAVLNNVPPGLLVIGDEIRLEQVFKNLLENAAKFTDSGGEIAFDCNVAADKVTISVRDTGCGIPPAQVQDVFDRFFQAENVASRPKRGLGLGLAICKNIVESHGGRIWLESEQGVGTTVFVELLMFNPDSELYDFDTNTGKATLSLPSMEAVQAER
jgi:signal transduction histidine kinase